MRATCLYVATKLGDVMDDLVVVGGLVPSLLIDQGKLSEGGDVHVGTMDLDVGLAVALLNQGRYRAITERLRQAGFSHDVNEGGNPPRQRWKIVRAEKVMVDFLIPPTLPEDTGGRIRDIEADFAAAIAPGLHLAFQDRRRVTLSSRTIMGEDATRDVWVCGPGAYVVLKALAFGFRGENKDAYGLHPSVTRTQQIILLKRMKLVEYAARMPPLPTALLPGSCGSVSYCILACCNLRARR